MTAMTDSTTTPARAPSPRFHIVLYQPQIPNNTGNIGRTCMATGCRLHVVHPIGFDMDEKACRRAGLDYWDLVDCVEHASWEEFLAKERPPTGGVPAEVHAWVDATYGAGHQLTLPMRADPRARSLNLATVVACGIYEGLRQTGGMVR